jgi:hypothetical protein
LGFLFDPEAKASKFHCQHSLHFRQVACSWPALGRRPALQLKQACLQTNRARQRRLRRVARPEFIQLSKQMQPSRCSDMQVNTAPTVSSTGLFRA